MSDRCYLNARLGAMRGLLLARSDYDRLLAAPDLRGISLALRETPYGSHLDSTGRQASEIAGMEEALRRNFQETLSRLLSISGVDCREAVRILLGSLELQVVKTVLRGKAAGLPPEEILASLVPTGIHGEAELRELCRQPNVRAVADLLATWRDPWGEPLSRAMKGYRDSRDLYLLEAALDRFRAGEAERGLRAIRPFGEDREDALPLFHSLSVDRANLMTALKAVAEEIPLRDPETYFLPGGRIYTARDFANLLASKSVGEALSLSARSLFAVALRPFSSVSGGILHLADVERELERVLLRAMRAQMRRDPLGWGPLASYLLNKTREIRNLRTICYGKRAGLPEIERKDLLILEY